jgi:hypothetical protein
MADLYAQVWHHLEGAETEIQNWQTLDGIKPVTVTSVGPERWIEAAHENGRMTPVECLALILFALNTPFSTDQDRRIVDGWAAELRKAVSDGEIQARDPFTLLPLEILPEGWKWLLSMADADKFMTLRNMGFQLHEVAEHVFKDCEKSIYERRMPPWEREQFAQTTPVNIVSADQPADAVRRLAALYALGGTAKYKNGEWKFTGIGKLAAQEKAADRKRIDPKVIRADLVEAAQAARDAKAAGFGSGLGQR